MKRRCHKITGLRLRERTGRMLTKMDAMENVNQESASAVDGCCYGSGATAC